LQPTSDIFSRLELWPLLNGIPQEMRLFQPFDGALMPVNLTAQTCSQPLQSASLAFLNFRGVVTGLTQVKSHSSMFIFKTCTKA